MKPKIAFFDFASCEGCQLALLNCEDDLLDLLELVDIVEFREAISNKAARYDIAFIEGSINREEDAERLRDIRSRAGILVAMGACASNGNVQSRSNLKSAAANFATVYGAEARDRVQTDSEHWALWAHTRVRRVEEIVEVDYHLRGCPMAGPEFLSLVSAILAKSKPRFAQVPVCVECKRAGNRCVFEQGDTCLGQITWGGCEAICISNGYHCDGCRGFLPGANIEAHRQLLREKGMTDSDIDRRYQLFCTSEMGRRR